MKPIVKWNRCDEAMPTIENRTYWIFDSGNCAVKTAVFIAPNTWEDIYTGVSHWAEYVKPSPPKDITVEI